MTAEKHTPGPWRWELNLKSKRLSLCGGSPSNGFGKFDLTVMDFVRWGMNGSQPRFRTGPPSMCIMKPAESFAAIHPERSHHVDWFQLINHPDAKLIEAAPDLLEACKDALATSNREMQYILDNGRLRDVLRAAIAKAEVIQS